ncbi:MAG: hypothetical protein GY730_07190 [bacterium]|nr:hypothetical protein [bacterium]
MNIIKSSIYRQRKYNRGAAILLVLVLISIILLEIMFLTKGFLWFCKNTDIEYYRIKTYYLAVSGKAFIKNNFDEIPFFQEPASKESIYNSISSAFFVNTDIDGDIYLIKTVDNIYSIGICENSYRAIIRFAYHIDDKKVVIDEWEKI